MICQLMACATEDDDEMLALLPTWFSAMGDKYQGSSLLVVLVSTLPKEWFLERPPGTSRTASSHMALA